MLAELLYALSGITGDIFILSDGKFELNPDFPHIHESERAQLNQILKLGYHYFTLMQFISACRKPPYQSPGLYLRSFCQGLDEVLDSYRRIILAAEETIMSEGKPSLFVITELFHSQFLVLPNLHELVIQIQENHLHGLQIYSKVLESSNTGILVLRAGLIQISKKMEGVLLKQLVAWAIFGTLNDPYFEFFYQGSSG